MRQGIFYTPSAKSEVNSAFIVVGIGNNYADPLPQRIYLVCPLPHYPVLLRIGIVIIMPLVFFM